LVRSNETWALTREEMRLGSEKGAEVGVAVFWGDPMSLDWERDGDALARRRPPPPLLLLPAPPCDAAAEAEEARGGFDDEGIVRERAEDSSWLEDGCCCCAPWVGEKGEEVDEMDDARDPLAREEFCSDDDGAARDGLAVLLARCVLVVVWLVLIGVTPLR
jgi:hypothetical protein